MADVTANDFVTIDIAFDPQDLAAAAYDFIRTRWPEYVAAPANLETWIIESDASVNSELANLIAVVSQEIFRQFGLTIVGIPQVQGQPSVGYTTWNAIDDLGYVIPEGTQLSIDDDAGNSYAFATTQDAIIASGDLFIADVPIQAVLPGAITNDVIANPIVISPIGFIQSVDITVAPANGEDPETDETYISRLAGELRTLSPKPILPIDFSRIALQNPAIDRALTVDLWDADTDTTGVEKYVGLVLLDEFGEEVSPAIEDATKAQLQAMRETNFVVTVGAPTYLEVDVTATVKATPGTDTTIVALAVEQALSSFLSPADWGSTVDPEVWLNQTVVRYLDAVNVVRSVVGVWYVEALTIGPNGGAMGTADLNIAGTVGLTRPGTFTVTVDA